MKYQKVQIIAKNNPTGSFAAGCPTNTNGSDGGNYGCKYCERTK